MANLAELSRQDGQRQGIISDLVCGPMLCTAVRGLSFFCNIYIRIYIINNNEIYKYII